MEVSLGSATLYVNMDYCRQTNGFVRISGDSTVLIMLIEGKDRAPLRLGGKGTHHVNAFPALFLLKHFEGT